jgi:hypothetical protein
MGKLKQLITQSEVTSKLEFCNQELDWTLAKFKVHTSAVAISVAYSDFSLEVQATGSTLSQIATMRQDAEQQHEELVEFLSAHPDLTNSDRSSVCFISLASKRSSLAFHRLQEL